MGVSGFSKGFPRVINLVFYRFMVFTEVLYLVLHIWFYWFLLRFDVGFVWFDVVL